MKYSRERAASAEILRIVLQKMAGQPAAFTPPNFSVWYEYSSGINPALSGAMNKLLNSGTKLDDDTVDNLYAEHVSECNSDIQEVLRGDIRQLLGKLSEFTAETDRQALHFSSGLQTYSDSLKGDMDAAELGSLINNMSSDTDKMRGSLQNLQTELAASKQEVEKLNRELESARGEALTDPLTGILNRRGFENRIQPILGDPDLTVKGLCLLMLDIDHFKKINDTYGHLLGDKVICAIANTLKSKVKGQDAVARLGGEEFAVLLPETNLEGAFAVGEQIRKSIENGKIRRTDTNDQIGGITISIGIAAYASGCDGVELLDRADKALYASKQGGRNRTTVFRQAQQ